MSIKEFSSKNSQFLFFSSLALLVIVIMLGVALAYSGRSGECRFGDERDGRGMMQERGDFNRIDRQGSGFIQKGAQSSVTTQVTTPTTDQAPESIPAQ